MVSYVYDQVILSIQRKTYSSKGTANILHGEISNKTKLAKARKSIYKLDGIKYLKDIRERELFSFTFTKMYR